MLRQVPEVSSGAASGKRCPPVILVIAALVVASSIWHIQPVAMATDMVLPEALGDPVSHHFSFTYENRIYTLGGYNGTNTDRVVIIDPIKNTTTLGTPLPYTVHGHAGVWTGEVAYLFGGITYTNPNTGESTWTKHILRYDPTTGNTTDLGDLLPAARDHMAAAWDGEKAYLLGGRFSGWPTCNGAACNSIFVFDPDTNSVTTATATLPQRIAFATAAFHGGYVYQFGGAEHVYYEAPTNSIVRYDPSTDVVTTLGTQLPYASHSSALAELGDRFYLTGGGGPPGSGTIQNVTRFDPYTLGLDVFPQPGHGGRAAHQTVVVNGMLFEVGGATASGLVASVETLHIDELTTVQFTSTPSHVSPGEEFQVCWQVTGIGQISHTDVHWFAPNPIGSTSSTTPDQTGTAPSTFCASVTTPLAATRMDVTAHATGPNEDLLSATVQIPVQV